MKVPTRLLLALLLASLPAGAADNYAVTQGAGTTLAAKDNAGVLIPQNTQVTNTGTAIYGTAGASSSAVISVQGIASGTALPVSGTVTATGTVAATQSGTWTVQPGNTANTTPWLVTNTPATSGGLSIGRVISAASTNATSTKGSAGQVCGLHASNTNAAARYLKLYNKATAPTVGSDTPVMTLLIPPNSSGIVMNNDLCIAFATGIAEALTTGVTDADTGAVAVNEIVFHIFYK